MSGIGRLQHLVDRQRRGDERDVHRQRDDRDADGEHHVRHESQHRPVLDHSLAPARAPRPRQQLHEHEPRYAPSGHTLAGIPAHRGSAAVGRRLAHQYWTLRST
jgi:hypothetical protein